MKSFVTGALLVLVTSESPVSQTDRDSTTAYQILAKSLDATGGQAAWSKLTTFAAVGDYEEAGGTVASVEVLAKAPSSYVFLLTFDDGTLGGHGFDGRNGWALRQGVVRDAPAELDGWIRREVKFGRIAHLAEMFPTLQTKGVTNVGGKEALIVDGTAEDGTSETWFFDSHTGLMLGRKFVLNLSNGQESTELFYEDYREINGVKIPFIIRQSSPSPHVITLTKVSFNAALDDSRFEKPTSP